MIYLEFTIPGPAVGKDEDVQIRYRVDRRGRRRPYPHFFPSPETERFMNTVTAQAQLAVLRAEMRHEFPTDDALFCEFVCFFTRPNSVPLSRKWPIAKPDCTNIQKAVEDAMHRVVFKNDSHVVSIQTSKRYCLPGVEPYTQVRIWTAREEDL